MESKNPFMLAQTLPDLMPFGISIHITENILTLILIIFFVFYAIVSGVLFYHWSAYGMNSFGIIVSESIYILVSITLFVIAGLSIYYF